MRISELGFLVEPLREMLYQADTLIRGASEREGKRVIGLACDMLPVEVLSAFDIVPLRLPAIFMSDHIICKKSSESLYAKSLESYDYIVFSKKCCHRLECEKTMGLKCLSFDNPIGYGEEASIMLHQSLEEILGEFGINLKDLDTMKLAEVTEKYNALRRMVRGICSLRKNKPDLISNDDMFVIFEAAQCLPPDLVIGQLGYLLERLNTEKSSVESNNLIYSMIYGGLLGDGKLLDEIEEAGCLIAEDDLCNGRRQFDLSHDASSSYLYYEILNSFSYRPLCSSVRPVEERFELLYRLLKNYDIETVIFISDSDCPCRNEQIGYLRVRLMRQGIDPLVISSSNAASVVGDYVKKVKGL
jgi:hypothetical protein